MHRTTAGRPAVVRAVVWMFGLLTVPVVYVIPASTWFVAEVPQDVEVIAAATAREAVDAHQVALGGEQLVGGAAQRWASDAADQGTAIDIGVKGGAGCGIARYGSSLIGGVEGQGSDDDQEKGDG
jgi:hypothetical protein